MHLKNHLLNYTPHLILTILLFSVVGFVGAFTITPSNLGIWQLQNSNTGNAEFTEDFSQSGNGSIRMTSGAGTGTGAGGKAFLGTNAFNGQTLGSLSSFSYGAMVDSASTHTGINIHVSVNIMVDINNNGVWDGIGIDDILVYEPMRDGYTEADKGTWGTYSPFAGGLWWSVSRIISQPGAVDMPANYSTWAQIMAGTTGGTPNTDLTIAAPTDLALEWHTFGFLFQVGQKSGGAWANFTGYLDGVAINGQSFDFELSGEGTSPAVQGCFIAPPQGLSVSNMTDDTYCDILMRNGQIIRHAGSVPQGLIDHGVVVAVEVYRLQGGISQRTFPSPAQICLAGTGRVIYLDNNGAPRVAVELPSQHIDEFTCASIPNPGTVVLISS